MEHEEAPHSDAPQEATSAVEVITALTAARTPLPLALLALLRELVRELLRELVMELVKAKSGLKALNVPYQGSAPSINAVLTQEVQMTLIDSGPIAALVKSGKLRALAVTSEQRLASYPQVPTLKEQGIDLAVNFWSGLLAPAGTPAPIVKRLQEEMARIMALPDVVERMAKLDIRPVGSSSADFAKTIATEIPLWTQVAKDNNIKAQ